jgi:hypothetical protein
MYEQCNHSFPRECRFIFCLSHAGQYNLHYYLHWIHTECAKSDCNESIYFIYWPIDPAGYVCLFAEAIGRAGIPSVCGQKVCPLPAQRETGKANSPSLSFFFDCDTRFDCRRCSATRLLPSTPSTTCSMSEYLQQFLVSAIAAA